MNKKVAVASIQEQFGYRDIKHRLPLGCRDETVEKCMRWQIPSIPINSNQQSNPSPSNKGTMYELSRKIEAFKESSTKDLFSSRRFPIISKMSNLENSSVTIASPNKMTEDPPHTERSSGYSSYHSNNYSFFHEKSVMEDTLYTQSLSRYSAQDFPELQDQIQISSSDETQESNLLFGINNSGRQDSVTRDGNEQEWPFAHLDASSWNTDVEYSGDDRIASLSKNEYSPSKPNSEVHHDTSFSCLDEPSTGLSAECSFFHENTNVVDDTLYTQNLSRSSVQDFLEPQGQIQTSSRDETQESNIFLFGINNGDRQDSVTKNINEQEWPFAHLDASSWNTDVENSEDERIAFWSKNEYSPRKRNSEVHHDTSFSSLDEPSIGIREELENFREKANECGSTNIGEPDEIGTLDEEVSVFARSFDIERSSPIENGIFGSLNSNDAAEFELHDQRRSDFDGNAARNGFQNRRTPNNLGSHSTSGTRHPSQTIADAVPNHGTSPRWTTEEASFSHGTTDNMPCNESFGKNSPKLIPGSDSRLTVIFEDMQDAWSDLEEPEGKEYSELDIKRTDFDLIENTVNRCNENAVKGASSKDWVQKTMGNGLTVYVHLPSGQTIHSPKCSSKVDSSKIIGSNETNLFSKRNLWPLPAGKSPFLLNKQRILHNKDKAIVASHNWLHDEPEKQNAHMENMVVEPQNNPKWTEGSYESWKGAECQRTTLDNMLTSWTNPMFLPNYEIAHISRSAR